MIVYDYDDLGRPIVAVSKHLGSCRIAVYHDWGVGTVRNITYSGKRRYHDRRLVELMKEIIHWGSRYGLPHYVVDTAAILARRHAKAITHLQYTKIDLIAVALLKIAAKICGIRFKAEFHRKGLMKMIKRIEMMLK